MSQVSIASDELDPFGPAAAPVGDATARVREVVVAQFGFIWRLLRHMGVAASDVDDAAQQVFLIASSKLDAVLPGHERSFLYTVANRVAARARLAQRRRAEREVEPEDLRDGAPNPEDALDSARGRALLDEVLDRMDVDLRAVFVLHEIEQVTMSEIASMLELPPGTVASRLRRARERFREDVQRIEARLKSRGGSR